WSGNGGGGSAGIFSQRHVVNGARGPGNPRGGGDHPGFSPRGGGAGGGGGPPPPPPPPPPAGPPPAPPPPPPPRAPRPAVPRAPPQGARVRVVPPGPTTTLPASAGRFPDAAPPASPVLPRAAALSDGVFLTGLLADRLAGAGTGRLDLAPGTASAPASPPGS